MSRKLFLLFLSVVFLSITAWFVFYFYQRFHYIVTDNAFQMADIVNVSTEDVSGKIVSIYVDEFDRVKKGQVLFCIDNTTEKIKVDELKAILKSVINKKLQLEKELERLKVVVPSEISALKKKIEETSLEVEKLKLKLSLLRTNYESGVKIAKEKVQSAKDFLASARENFKFWKKRLQRYKNLYERRVISKEQLEEIENRFKSAKAGFSEALLRLSSAKENLKIALEKEKDVKALEISLRQAQKELESLKKKLRSLEAEKKRIQQTVLAIKELEAREESVKKQLETAKVLLAHTCVKSPIDGVVAKKWKEVGDFVSPGSPVFSIYDQNDVYVLAWIDEDDVADLSEGAKARIKLETCSMTVEGRVFQIGSSAGSVFSIIPRDTSQGEYTKVVQRIPVKVGFVSSVPKECLKVGTNAVVWIERK